MKHASGSAGSVVLMAEWSLDRLLWSPRTLAMGATALFPAALALLFTVVSALGFEVPVSGFGFFSLVTATVGFQFIAPMLALFYSSGILVDELEAGTLVYLITRPRSRASLLAGKMTGSLAVAAILFLPSVVLTFFFAVAPGGWEEVGRYFPTMARDLGAAVLGLAAYSGLFAAIGVLFRRPVLVGAPLRLRVAGGRYLRSRTRRQADRGLPSPVSPSAREFPGGALGISERPRKRPSGGFGSDSPERREPYFRNTGV